MLSIFFGALCFVVSFGLGWFGKNFLNKGFSQVFAGLSARLFGQATEGVAQSLGDMLSGFGFGTTAEENM